MLEREREEVHSTYIRPPATDARPKSDPIHRIEKPGKECGGGILLSEYTSRKLFFSVLVLELVQYSTHVGGESSHGNIRYSKLVAEACFHHQDSASSLL